MITGIPRGGRCGHGVNPSVSTIIDRRPGLQRRRRGDPGARGRCRHRRPAPAGQRAARPLHRVHGRVDREYADLSVAQAGALEHRFDLDQRPRQQLVVHRVRGVADDRDLGHRPVHRGSSRSGVRTRRAATAAGSCSRPGPPPARPRAGPRRRASAASRSCSAASTPPSAASRPGRCRAHAPRWLWISSATCSPSSSRACGPMPAAGLVLARVAGRRRRPSRSPTRGTRPSSARSSPRRAGRARTRASPACPAPSRETSLRRQVVVDLGVGAARPAGAVDVPADPGGQRPVAVAADDVPASGG